MDGAGKAIAVRGDQRQQHEEGTLAVGFMFIAGFGLLDVFSCFNYQDKQSHGVMNPSLEAD